VILDGKTGFLCEEGSVDGPADVLVQIAEGKKDCPTIVKAGRQHIEENFSLTRQLEEMNTIYKCFVN
jgi:colanic acid/amylovoran biosynthesis glycosyltransferase